MAECFFTPRKGSHSCRGCVYSLDPQYNDPGCGLPKEIWEKVRQGYPPGKAFPVVTEPGKVSKQHE